MLKELFRKPKYVTVKAEKAKRDIPEGLWHKCPECGEIIYNKELEKNQKVCGKCNYHFRMGANERIAAIIDEGTFVEFDADLQTTDPLNFPNYKEKIKATQEATGNKEAIVTGEGNINDYPIQIAVMDSTFIMASMGSVVGEKIVRAIERAIDKKQPLVIFAASGGARMQEGIVSLMQMAKTSAALARLGDVGELFISVFTDPTTGGVTASFASLGDIIIAEPGALIAFTGPRVIQQTIRQTLPPGFQKAEFLLEHGFVDMIIHREEMKATLANLVSLHNYLPVAKEVE
jgi:acetyl-CoA carboxylase carboxyl transferase subunit beta